MNRINRSMMHALQRYTPEHKEEALSRAERTWRPEPVDVDKSAQAEHEKPATNQLVDQNID